MLECGAVCSGAILRRVQGNWHISAAAKRAKMNMRKIDKTLTPSAKAAAVKHLSYFSMVPMEKPPRIKGSWTRK